MSIRKEVTEENELILWLDGKVIYKRWINRGISKVFDVMAYDEDAFVSIVEDKEGNVRSPRKIFLNGYTCKSTKDFWNSYANQIPVEYSGNFGKNIDAFRDAIEGGGPGFPGECLIEIIGVKNLLDLFGELNFEMIITLLRNAKFVDLVIEDVESLE